MEPSLFREIILTRKTKNYKRYTAQSQRDYECIKKRMMVNGVKTDYVSAYMEKQIGEHVTLVNLLSIAEVISNQLNLKIDRLAKRNRSALLCWYAENWDKISPLLLVMNNKLRSFIRSPKKCDSKEYTFSNSSSDEYFDPSDINTLLNAH
ncbi:hypothetical protein TVAG_385210 [Trichomonas vaginalis G3]|uniref:Uncharacterized protein n=1 Tax=Trichomonas vaginalis (strain ATCC PRA-98 / G3) TaxID=412133 RepID=A2FIY4_TRIV3|nr:hypothetical protein TVAGG3_0794590 [Trichomonas vaginalis G3]EAX95133.1 hypothetical protein TVAG_385210 [Trichomonas vaginalis G3]KAI5496068.1 hypothetical protein TVAGG3_0794590 [Trichomonas vaginalis G3]|eukprot:XP_001308063.1 hypothetical protein [Trichomonas vaginalis G3]